MLGPTTPHNRTNGAPDLILIEGRHTGHRMDYCVAVLRYTLKVGRRPALATTSTVRRSDEYGLRQVSSISHTSIPLRPPGRGERAYVRWLLRACRELGGQYPGSQILVLEGDKMLPYLTFRRLPEAPRLTVLVMRLPRRLDRSVAQRPSLAVKVLLSHAVKRQGVRVAALSPASPAQDCYRRVGLEAVPDPVEVTPGVGWLSLDPARHWFGVFGHITPRKNLDLVARAIEQSGPRASGLIVAGRVAPAARLDLMSAVARLQSVGAAVVVEDRLLLAEELDSAIAEVDTAVVAHSSDGPSGIVGKAAALGTWVVAAGATELRDHLSTHPSFGEWVPLECGALAGALARSRTRTMSRGRPNDMAGPSDFARAVTGFR